MMLLFLWAAAVAAALYLYFQKIYSFFSSRGVKTNPAIPPFGHMMKASFKKEHFISHMDRIYFNFPKEKILGRYEFTTPILIIRDLEMIKKIAVKEFDYFVDRRQIVDPEADPLITKNLFSMKAKDWRDMRPTLSPAFTSSKIRLMVPFMIEVGDQMVKALKKKIEVSETDSIEIEAKDLTSRYANDVIASCAFGLKVDSLEKEDNEFYAMGRASSTLTFKQIILFFGYSMFPMLMKWLKVSIFSSEAKSFFRGLVMGAMQEREEKQIVRNDMIHLLMEAKKGRLIHEEKNTKDIGAGFATVEESQEGKKEIKREWSDEDLVAQAMIFFLAGFDTVSSVMTFLIYELALHPEVQDKLVEEIRENHRKNNGKFDYNSILNMTYLDMVVSEVMRLWPPALALDRVCLKDYNCGKPNSKSTVDFIIPRGMNVNIPVWSIHRDPDYFPNPLKFDPERFSEENKHNIKPYTYLPFGVGPRNCIGSRFALCEMKVMVYQLLQHIEISPCEKTCVPPVLATDTFHVKLKGGHWVQCKVRT